MREIERRFGIYEKALKPQSWEPLLEDVARAGYDYFELSLDESDARLARLEWSAAQIAEVASAERNSGVTVFSACFSGHRRFPLGSADPVLERRALRILRQGIELSARLGIRVMQIAGYDVFYEPSSAETAARYVDNLATGVQWASQAGVMLAIEPVEVFLTSISSAMEVVRKIDSPWLQLYPDVSNMASLGIDPVAEIPRGSGHMVAIHVRDSRPNFFYNVPLGEGIMNFEAVFTQLDNVCYSGPLIVEMWNMEEPDYLAIITHAREFFLKKIAAARDSSKKRGMPLTPLPSTACV